MSFTIDLTGKRALVTGAGQHTGRQFSLALADSGAEVGVCDIDAAKAEAVVAEIHAAGGQAHALVYDVTDHAQVHPAVTAFAPDILVNNTGGTAAIMPIEPFVDTLPPKWERIVAINLFGVLNHVHAALPRMQEQRWGRIITIISDASRRGDRGQAVYGASKAGAAGFMRGIAAEAGFYGVTANCMSFGTLRYEGMQELPAEMQKRMLTNYSIKRQGEPTDPVGLLLLLASDHASWITGQVIPVNGGYVQAL